jgi:hypothetical protein
VRQQTLTSGLWKSSTNLVANLENLPAPTSLGGKLEIFPDFTTNLDQGTLNLQGLNFRDLFTVPTNLCSERFFLIFHIATKSLVDSFTIALLDFCGFLKLVGELFVPFVRYEIFVGFFEVRHLRFVVVLLENYAE